MKRVRPFLETTPGFVPAR
ncbi:Hypothetical protein SLIV_19412 [Streptomyces lividans TK24]|uniref:Uncharacterized protein n=1 Tax=Streptomyces lividans TK24 TaxID=457428 RepID=A0ABX6TRB2_STRLI|nr:Hypothetical protein SLIV_19412 [Streptomyces lividans TK24]QSJ10389.1 Hypothetical protein SLIVDG2_19412 [Streptomyces lividans]QTD71299.1 Hypothetical protein SLIVYQS_19412 [Streptomyces lividans TK24] [Streptomyces lividans]